MSRIDYTHYYRVKIPADRNGEFMVKRYDTEDELLDDMKNIPNGAWIETVYEHGRGETIIGNGQT